MGINNLNIVSANQVNVASDNSTINITQTFDHNQLLADINNTIKELEKLAGDTDSEQIKKQLADVKDGFKNGVPSKSTVGDYIKNLSAVVAVANGAPVLYENIQKLIGLLGKLI